jgi:hypothetical protein
VLWRVPNAYEQSEIARSYRGLAAVLGGTGMPSKPDDGPDDGPEDGDPPGIPAKDPIFNDGFLVCWPS